MKSSIIGAYKAPKKQNGDPDGRTTEYAMFKKYEKELETIDLKYSDIIKWSVGQLDNFNDIIRAYLKEEWKKAKEGK